MFAICKDSEGRQRKLPDACACRFLWRGVSASQTKAMKDVGEREQMPPKEKKVEGRRKEVKEEGKRDRVNEKAEKGKRKRTKQKKRKENDKVKKEVKEGLEERLTVVGIGEVCASQSGGVDGRRVQRHRGAPHVDVERLTEARLMFVEWTEGEMRLMIGQDMEDRRRDERRIYGK